MSVEAGSRIAGRRYGVSAAPMPALKVRPGTDVVPTFTNTFNLAPLGSNSMIAGHKLIAK
jgi:hypothetical protein